MSHRRVDADRIHAAGRPERELRHTMFDRGIPRMRVMVALEDRFARTGNGRVYSDTNTTYSFWQRYLQVFDGVCVLARVRKVDDEQQDKQAADGPGVQFLDLPYYVGPWQCLKEYPRLRELAKQAIEECEAFIIRAPGVISGLMWRQIRKSGRAYGVEVVSDPAEVLSVFNARSVATPLAKLLLKRDLARQCRGASAAAYVTESILQEKYPCRCWSTFFSSIDLQKDAIVDEQHIVNRLRSLQEAGKGIRPYRICHVGTMELHYKAQDYLIEAVSMCRAKGVNVDLTLVGAGRRAGYFQKKACRLGVQDAIRFLGALPPGPLVVEQLDKADLFVLPSTTEGMPRALIEAMARGMPCIGTHVGGIPELLHSEDMVPARNAVRLASKILSTITNAARLERMARRNVQAARKYGYKDLNARRVQFYRKVTACSNSGNVRIMLGDSGREKHTNRL